MIAYTAYPTDGRVRLEAESLVRWGYEVCILALKNDKQPRTYSLCGVEVIELNVAKYRGKKKLSYLLSYLHFLVLAFLACTQMFFKSRTQAIHIHNMPDVLVFAAIIPRIFGCKLILDIHDTIPETYAGKFEASSGILFKLLTLEEQICCALAHKVICVNDVQREAVIARGIPKDKVYTVITMPTFASIQQGRDTDDNGAFRVVNHGTISKRLGTDVLIRAAARLAETIPSFELHIIGCGDDWDEMVHLAENLGAASQVKFRDSVAWDVLPEVLSGMQVGVVANRANIATHLMLPLKLIDYVTLRIPVVVPRLKAIEYYFTPEMVSFFEPENIESLVQAVLTLYRDRNLRKQQAVNATRFIERYNWRENSGLQDVYAVLFEQYSRLGPGRASSYDRG